MQKAINELGALKVKQLVTLYARDKNVPPELHIDYVCNACCAYPDLAPSYSVNQSPEQCVKQWVTKFIHGYNERISVRRSNMPRTIPDEAVNTILSAGLKCQPDEKINQIIYAHRVSMSAENILGLLLEEFLFCKLSPLGWAMAWGETVKSVDFCNATGGLLQVKNRSNSENSSSSRVRLGTQIVKWFRVNAMNGHYEWDNLKTIIGAPAGLELSEDSFRSFIGDVLRRNPSALAIEPNNPWKKI